MSKPWQKLEDVHGGFRWGFYSTLLDYEVGRLLSFWQAILFLIPAT